MNKLVLFDIDGILLSTSARPSKYVIKKHFGIDVDLSASYVEGMTDKLVLITRLKSCGIKNPEEDPRFETALKDYGKITAELLPKYGVDKIPGAEDFVKRLLEEKIHIGILTGNTEEKAKVKLDFTKLSQYFEVGAYGDETTIRSELVPIALNDAKEKLGIKFDKKNVFIVGDTIRDVACAKEGGVKSIAVATGKENVEELKKANSDFVFKDFSDVEAILKVIK